MNEENVAAPTVPYIVHEAALARLERVNKRIAVMAALEVAAFVLIAFLHRTAR